MEYWKRQCDAIKKRKSEAIAAKSKAEEEYNDARTQQEAEVAGRNLKEAIENLKAMHPAHFISIMQSSLGNEIAQGACKADRRRIGG